MRYGLGFLGILCARGVAPDVDAADPGAISHVAAGPGIVVTADDDTDSHALAAAATGLPPTTAPSSSP